MGKKFKREKRPSSRYIPVYSVTSGLTTSDFGLLTQSPFLRRCRECREKSDHSHHHGVIVASKNSANEEEDFSVFHHWVAAGATNQFAPIFFLPWTAAAGALEEDVNKFIRLIHFGSRWWRGSKNFFFPRIGQITGPGERTERSRWSMIWHQSFYWPKEIRGGKIQIRGRRVRVHAREWQEKRGAAAVCAATG